MRGAETMAWSRHQQVARGYLGNAPPPRIRFFTKSKKIRRSKHATNTHKHGRGSYLSDGIRGDSQSPVEAEPLRSLCGAFAEPLRSKDRGFFSYNIDEHGFEIGANVDGAKFDLTARQFTKVDL